MRAVRLIPQNAATRRPIIKDTQAEAIWPIKKSAAKILIEPGSRSKLVVKAVHKNRHVTLFLVVLRTKRRKLIGSSNQELLEIVASNLPPIVNVTQRHLVAHPVRNSVEIHVRPDAAVATVIDHPIFWHARESSPATLMHEADCPKIV